MDKQYLFIPANDGINYLGGDIPQEFTIPENNCPGSFQYLGFLNKNDPAFDWLPSDIHLICPVYMNMEEVWLDYSDPLKPAIVNLDEINDLDTEYDDLKSDSVIIYEKVNFDSHPNTPSLRGSIGLAGVPSWIQHDEIPVSPRTNKPMRFLCQLEYTFEPEIKVRYTNVEPEDEWFKSYFSTMNFWGDGDLYVFFEPETNIACYFIQKT